MKKFAALLIALVLLTLTASTAFAKTVYDPEKTCFVVVAKDEETGSTYVTELGYKATVKRIAAGLVYDLFILEVDALVRVEFKVTMEHEVILTHSITGENITE